MSKYKPFYSSLWSDPHFESYSIEKKLLFVFLITNNAVEKSGIYKLTIKQISFYTDISKKLIEQFLNDFINEGKIQYNFDAGIIFIKNVFKFQKGMIKNKKIMFISLLKNYDMIKTDFWYEFFEIYKNDEVINEFINDAINKNINDFIINKKTHPSKQKHTTKNASTKENPQFEDFWKKYTPLTTRDGTCVPKGDKQKAKKSFEKALKETTFEKLLECLESYLTNCKKNNILTKHAVSWLNSKPWTYELEKNVPIYCDDKSSASTGFKTRNPESDERRRFFEEWAKS